MKILLVLNKPNREIPIMESIKKELLRVNKDVIVEIKEMSVPGFNKFVFKFKPNVILTFPFTCVGFSQWYYIFKVFLRTKIISLRAEGAVDFSSETNIEWAVGFDSYGKTLIDYELFWGEQLANVVGEKLLLQQKISSMDRIKIVGYPRLESYKIETRKMPLPTRIQEYVKQYKKEQIVLFISGFHLGNYTKQNLFDAKDLDAENRLEELLEAVEISKRFRSEWMRNILLTAQENPTTLIILKKHPIERREDYRSLEGIDNILFIYEDIQIDEIIPYAGVFFHYGSTALIDAYLSKIPAIYVYSKKNKQWYSDLGWPSSKKVEIEQVSSTVHEFLEGKIKYKASPEIKKIMHDVFNLTEDQEYEPSKEIAKIILTPSPIQEISLWDKYFLMAIFFAVCNPVRWRFVGLFRRILKMLKILQTKFPKQLLNEKN